MTIRMLFQPLIFVVLAVPGCATVLQGYDVAVPLRNAPDSVRVFTEEGMELPLEGKLIMGRNGIVLAPEVRLRTAQDHTLLLRSGGTEKRVRLYRHLDIRWAAVDLLFFAVPSFYDAYTGCWNTFPDIDASFAP